VKLEAGNSVEAPKEDMAGKKRKAEEVHTPPPSPLPLPHPNPPPSLPLIFVQSHSMLLGSMEGK